MASRRRKKKPNGEPTALPARQRKFVPIATALLGVGILAMVVLLTLPGRQVETAKPGEEPQPATPTTAKGAGTSQPGLVQTGGAANRPATASDAKAGFDVLQGKWRRPDGGYVVEVRSVDASGKLDASYFNPHPIHVAKAEASQDGPATKVFIELRDTNYPGSTYHLTYDAQSDQLQGIYYQAALQQSYEVVFVRMD